MPRVVDNQLETFRTDPILSNLAQITNIRFAGCPHAKDSERKQTFMQNCANKCLPVSFPSHGVNLDLTLYNVREQNNEVHFESTLIFNGVCCRLKGHINRSTLVGTAQFEFDAERAKAEEQKAKPALIYSQKLADLRKILAPQDFN